MFGYARNSGVHWLRDYGDALHKYESTTDIRGRTEEPKRPLGHRKSTDQYSIRKEDDGTIACVLYRSPVVRFKPDGDIIVRDFSYPTVSTCYFIDEVLGGRVSARLFNGSICIRVGGVESRLASDTDLVLRKNEEGALYPVNPTTDTTHHIVRGMPNKVRKEFTPFLEYCKNMLKLRDKGEFMLEEYNQVFKKTEDITKTYKLYLDCPEGIGEVNNMTFAQDMKLVVDYMRDTNEETQHLSYYKALLGFARSFGRNVWGTQGYETAGYWITYASIEKAVREIAMGVNRDKVFQTIEIPTGVIVRDRYADYFRGGWDKYHEKI